MLARSCENLIYTGMEIREFRGQDGNDVRFVTYNFLVDDESGKSISFNSTKSDLTEGIKRMESCKVIIDIQYTTKGLKSKLVEILNDDLEQ